MTHKLVTFSHRFLHCWPRKLVSLCFKLLTTAAVPAREKKLHLLISILTQHVAQDKWYPDKGVSGVHLSRKHLLVLDWHDQGMLWLTLPGIPGCPSFGISRHMLIKSPNSLAHTKWQHQGPGMTAFLRRKWPITGPCSTRITYSELRFDNLYTGLKLSLIAILKQAGHDLKIRGLPRKVSQEEV